MSKTPTQWDADNEHWRKVDEAKAKETANRMVRLIDPRTDRQQACRDAALKAIRQMEVELAFLNGKHLNDDRMRKKLGRFARLVAKVKPAWNDMGDVFPVDMPPSLPASLDVVLEFGRRCGEAAEKDKSENRLTDWDADKKRIVVKHAYGLMMKYAVKKPVAHDGSSTFCLLAKLMHGDGVDMISACKLFIRAERAKGAS